LQPCYFFDFECSSRIQRKSLGNPGKRRGAAAEAEMVSFEVAEAARSSSAARARSG
jgi:hypothetical protein